MTSHAITHPEGRRLQDNLRRVILGKDDVLALVITGLVARGHLLMEDVPGVGKTTLARSLARSLDLDFKRVQFTPDLMPTDILGGAVLRPADGTFEFRPGPIFTQVLLADEINRASPRTQSALLEAMQRAAGHHRRGHPGAAHPLLRAGHPELGGGRAPTPCPRPSSTAS
jgi:MoxR-like ATPase